MQVLETVSRIVHMPFVSYRFIVVGCGGTGSYLVRDLARLISVSNSTYGRSDSMILADADVIEEHNLNRQNFITSDIGKNKAEVLALRYGKSFGVNVGFLPEYLRESNAHKLLINSFSLKFILIGCVDNNKTRKILHDMYRNNSEIITYIDSGNEQYAGQVVFSTKTAATTNGTQIRFNYSNEMYDAYEAFEMTPDDRHPDDLSCAERAVHAPQSIATNIMAANVLFNYCNTILDAVGKLNRVPESPLDREEAYKNVLSISAHISYFNARTGSITTVPFNKNIKNAIDNQFNRTKKRNDEIRQRLAEEEERIRNIMLNPIG